MNETAKALLRPFARPIWQRAWWRIEDRIRPAEARLDALEARVQAAPPAADATSADPRLDRTVWVQQRTAQLALLHQYRALAASGGPLPAFLDTEFSAHSQNGEDGLLLFVFSLVGFATRLTVEIAAGDGIECNSANLIVNHGFTGLLVDGNPQNCERGRAFYARHPATAIVQPRMLNTWIERDTVDEMIAANVPPGEVDLLSIDIDGNDYWVLERITCIRPRVIIVEFHSMWRGDRACTIPYDPQFRFEIGGLPYCGASLPAFVKLLKPRGYRLVAIDRLAINGVFVRDDLAPGLLPERTVTELFERPPMVYAGGPVDHAMMHAVASRPWVDV
jgi:hypothetical protein